MVQNQMISLTREDLLKSAEGLPTGPRVLAELEQVLAQADASLESVGNILRPDTGITSRIVRISNSPIYSRGAQSSSIEEAIGRLGMGEVRRVAAMAAMATISEHTLAFYGVTAVQLRENSLLVALISEQLAEKVNLDPKTAYTAGLLRSTGKIVLDRLARRPGAKVETLQPWDNDLGLREQLTFGWTNAAVGADVLKAWRFPVDIYVSIRDHYLAHLTVEPLPMALLLNLAAAAAEKAALGFQGEACYWANEHRPHDSLGLTPEDLEASVQRATDKFATIREFLK